MDEQKTENSQQPGSPETPAQEQQAPQTPEQLPEATPSPVVSEPSVSWEASEFINHQKSMNWYLGLTGVMIIIGVILFLTVRDIFSLVVLVVMYIALIIFARREPRTLRYTVGPSGISIGDKHFTYDQFRSFSIIQETGVPSISLDPTQRFMPSVSIYFAPDEGDKIIAELAKYLPQEQKGLSAIDKALLKIRF